MKSIKNKNSTTPASERAKRYDKKHGNQEGFTITELTVAVVIVGLLSSFAIPSYRSHLCKTNGMEAEATIGSLKAIISGFADETGSMASSWDELGSISTIMTNNGPASGSLSNKITLPGESYELRVIGPTNASYQFEANSIGSCKEEYIKACIDLKSGASDIIDGGAETSENTPNCG